jgi:purine-nucleoside phosphorylase
MLRNSSFPKYRLCVKIPRSHRGPIERTQQVGKVNVLSLYDSVQESLTAIRSRISVRPEAALILGTGLGGVAERISAPQLIPYEEIPHFPASTVEGHRGRLVFGTLAGKQVVAMQGRLHYYEGYSLRDITLPVRVMRELGASILIINSAAGGLNPGFKAGDAMVVTDHINLMGDSPLRGLADDRLGERFPDMSKPYDAELIDLAGKVAVELKISVRYGVYAAVAGPNLETRAETKMLRILGADAVGMSTVPEVIVAAQVGFRTLALAAITNVNLPDAMEPISIQRVIANAQVAEPRLASIVEETLRQQ